MAKSIWSGINPRLRRAFRAAVLARHGPTCHLCTRPIDLRLPRWHTGSYEADHLVPPSRGGALLDPANGRPAHKACNAAKKDRPITQTWRPSLDW